MSRKKTKTNNLVVSLLGRMLLRPLKFYIGVLVIIAIPVLMTYQAVTLDVLAQDTRALEQQKETLQSQVDALQVEIDQLTNINRIEKLAREQFGLVGGNDEMERMVINEYPDETGSFAEKPVQEKETRVTHAGVH
jgi:cell division protein FtsL